MMPTDSPPYLVLTSLTPALVGFAPGQQRGERLHRSPGWCTCG
jgi:hypothetical protein